MKTVHPTALRCQSWALWRKYISEERKRTQERNALHCLSDVDHANASRIVACVNACAGMDDPVKEIAEMKDKLTELATLVDTVRKFQKEYFRTRDRVTLSRSKELERQLDGVVEQALKYQLPL